MCLCECTSSKCQDLIKASLSALIFFFFVNPRQKANTSQGSVAASTTAHTYFFLLFLLATGTDGFPLLALFDNFSFFFGIPSSSSSSCNLREELTRHGPQQMGRTGEGGTAQAREVEETNIHEQTTSEKERKKNMVNIFINSVHFNGYFSL